MRLYVLVMAVAVAGCSTSTATMQVEGDPIARVALAAEQAAGWAVTERSAGAVEVREIWPAHSVVMLGVSAFYAELRHDPPELVARFYLQSSGLMTLGLPQRIDVEDGVYGAALKPRLRESAVQVLDWAGVRPADRPAFLRFQ